MRVHGAAPLGDILLVVFAQVVAEVVATVEGRITPRAPGVVAVVGFLILVRPVLVFVVAVEIGVALEGNSLAAGDETAVAIRGLVAV